MNTEEIKINICNWAGKFLESGILSEGKGYLSFRFEDKMYITAGNDLSKVNESNIAEVNIEDAKVIGNVQPDEIFKLHAGIYKKTKFNALVHSYQPNTLTSSQAGQTVYPLLDDLAQIAGPTVRVARFSLSDIEASVKPAIKGLKRRSAVLLKDNGAICGAGNFDDAGAVALVLEKGCKAFIESSFLGGGIKINFIEANLMRFVYQLKYSKANETNV